MSDESAAPASQRPFTVNTDPAPAEPERPERVHTDGSDASADDGGHETGGGHDGNGPGPTGS